MQKTDCKADILLKKFIKKFFPKKQELYASQPIIGASRRNHAQGVHIINATKSLKSLHFYRVEQQNDYCKMDCLILLFRF